MLFFIFCCYIFLILFLRREQMISSEMLKEFSTFVQALALEEGRISRFRVWGLSCFRGSAFHQYLRTSSNLETISQNQLGFFCSCHLSPVTKYRVCYARRNQSMLLGLDDEGIPNSLAYGLCADFMKIRTTRDPRLEFLFMLAKTLQINPMYNTYQLKT